jgi:hypothetical protein
VSAGFEAGGTEPGRSDARARAGREPSAFATGVLWIALAIALSPALLEIAGHARTAPWARYAIVPLALLFWAAAAERRSGVPRPLGLVLVFAGLAVQMAALVAGPAKLGRAAVPAAVIGMASWLGRPSLPVAVLSLWAVPVPNALVQGLAPALDPGILALAPALARPLDPELRSEGRALRSRDEVLRIDEADGGLPLAALLSGVGWFSALRSGLPLSHAALRAALWGAAAIPIQIAAVALAAFALPRGGAAAARAWLDSAWVGVALAGVAWSEWQRRA